MNFAIPKKRSPIDTIFAVALLAAMLVSVWMIGNFIVDGGGVAPAPTTASPCELVHRT